jgi:hypothetical protein
MVFFGPWELIMTDSDSSSGNDERQQAWFLKGKNKGNGKGKGEDGKGKGKFMRAEDDEQQQVAKGNGKGKVKGKDDKGKDKGEDINENRFMDIGCCHRRRWEIDMGKGKAKGDIMSDDEDFMGKGDIEHKGKGNGGKGLDAAPTTPPEDYGRLITQARQALHEILQEHP